MKTAVSYQPPMLIATVTGTRCSSPPPLLCWISAIHQTVPLLLLVATFISIFALPKNIMLNKLNSISLYLIISVTFVHYLNENEQVCAIAIFEKMKRPNQEMDAKFVYKTHLLNKFFRSFVRVWFKVCKRTLK
jgi:hypothetical protein